MWILKRLKEPSTWAGLSALAVMFNVPREHIDAVTQVVGAVTAAAAVFMPEQKG